MDEQEVMKLLRHYRHDWMNELQIILGYAQMGKLDKVEEKIKSSVEIAEKERELQRLPLPKTALRIIQLKCYYENFRIDFLIQQEGTISADDDQLVTQLDQLMNYFVEHSIKTTLYHGTIKLHQAKDSQLQLSFDISDEFLERENLLKKISKIDHSMVMEKRSYKEDYINFLWTVN
ncbi:Spo0B domain-containing protein [Paraliobacillus salinarum]|uniref:Spo0B domain-containing protein n=1 Tax=Paraliobacillus salinarum TaxID=1158996 RepID=UPI0015F66526|nr:Spo0B domain-containing protein [Paraliobacillus salinarum]